MPHVDLLLRGGTVIDGSGAPGMMADVAIAGNRISAVEPSCRLHAEREIDCAGLVVAPGFVDLHNHSDGWLLKTRHLTSKTLQGFTTEVLMSDGISYAPVTEETAPQWLYYLRSLNGLQVADYSGWRSIADYMSCLDRQTVQNSVAQIPYANVRTLVMGWGRQSPDDTELRRMQYEIRQGMEQGATGLSTGLDYVSQCFAGTEELVEACSAMSSYEGIYVTHVRYKKGLVPAVREAVEIGRRARVRVHLSHLKGSTQQEADELLEYIDRVAVHEVDFSFDVYPYLPGSTMLNSLLPYEVWEDGPLAVLSKLGSARVRARFAAQLADYRLSLDQIRIAWLPSVDNRPYVGLSLAEYAERRAKPPADALCDLLIDENLAVLCVFYVGDDRMVEPFLQHPKFMIGSDGIWFADGRVHPRQYGSASRILGPLVRDRQLFSLEAAVRKLSGLPAERFGLRDRGAIRAGAFADLVVFNPKSIADRATYDQPHQPSAGLAHVLVNGRAVVLSGEPVSGLEAPWPGRALRYQPGGDTGRSAEP